jgi:hypothetical protein
MANYLCEMGAGQRAASKLTNAANVNVNAANAEKSASMENFTPQRLSGEGPQMFLIGKLCGRGPLPHKPPNPNCPQRWPDGKGRAADRAA